MDLLLETYSFLEIFENITCSRPEATSELYSLYECGGLLAAVAQSQPRHELSFMQGILLGSVG